MNLTEDTGYPDAMERRMINVLGDMNVSCLLDGKEREVREVRPLVT